MLGHVNVAKPGISRAVLGSRLLLCDTLAGVILGQTVRILFPAGRSVRPTGPQADFERPGVSSLRPGVTTAQSGRVVRWVEPSGRLRSRPESAAVWSWHVPKSAPGHVPKSAPWLVGRGGNEPHWVPSIVVLWWGRPRTAR